MTTFVLVDGEEDAASVEGLEVKAVLVILGMLVTSPSVPARFNVGGEFMLRVN